MQKLRKVSVITIILCILLSLTVSAFADTDSTGLTVETQQLDDKGIDIAELKAAVRQRDTDKLVDMLMKWLLDYYRQNGLKDDFEYFNADVYLATYQDVNNECDGDKQKALEHYIVIGAKEGRISGGKYDLPLAVRIDPSFLLREDILSAMGDPAAFLKAAEKSVEMITKGSLSTSVISDEDNTQSGPSSYTLIIYGSGADLDIAGDFLTGIMALYGTENVNIILTLGGSYTWYNDYLTRLLGPTEGSTNEKNKTGFFAVNVSELNSALDTVSKETGNSVSSMISKITEGTEEGQELKKKVSSVVYTDKVLPLVDGTTVSTDKPLGSQETLKTVLELAKTKYTADTYALTFTGHGGGPGGCLTSDDGTQCVDTSMIDAALNSAEFGEENRMSLIAFDACSMGCIETAAVLGKYCEYMYGSEALQPGSLDMAVWINAVKNNLNSNELSKAVAYAIYEERASISEILPTAAISNPNYAQEVLDAIEQWSEAMLTAMKGQDKDKYFQALKKASVYCFQISPECVLDVKDLMQEVKSFLNEQNINDMDEKTDAVINAMDALSEQNSVGRYDKILFDSNKGGVIKSNEEYREKHLKYDLCGFSITFPNHLITHLASATENEANHFAEIREKIAYISKFNGLGLKKYTEFINEYLNYYLTTPEVSRIRNLSQEMTSRSHGDNPVAGYKDIASVSWNEDKTFVQVDIKDYAKASNRSEYSSGDAYMDVIDTAKEFRAYLTSKLVVNRNDSTSKYVDMIFASDTISYDNMLGYQSRIELPLNTFLKSASRLVSYVEKEGVAWADADYLDLLIDAQQTGTTIYKEDVLQAVDQEVRDLITERAKAEQAYKDDPTDTNKQAWDEVENKLEEVCKKYTLYYGKCTSSSNATTSNTYLIFQKDSNGNLVYFDSAEKSTEDDTYQKISDVKSIQFYHYEFSNVLSNGKDTGTDQLTVIDKGSYYDGQKYVYDVTDGKQVIIKTIKLSDFMGLEENYICFDSLGYYITMTNADGQTVVLNSDANGQNKALSNDGVYTTPLTQGQLRELLGIQSTVQSEVPTAPEELTEQEESKEAPTTETESSINDSEELEESADQETQKEQEPPIVQSEQKIETEQQTISEEISTEESVETKQLEITEQQPSAVSETESAA